MEIWLGIVIGLLLTVGTGIFVAAEFSLVALDRQELERRQEAGEKGLGRTIKVLTKTATHLSSAQLGITLTTLLAGYAFEPALSELFAGPLAALGVGDAVRPAITAPLAVIVATLISMLLGELVPKNFAIALPLATARFVVPFQAAFTAVFKPFVLLLNGSANGLLRRVGIEPKEELSGARSAEELSSLVRHSAEAGSLEADTATLLDRTLRFSELTAADAMTPRLRVEAVQRGDTADELIALSGRTGFSRFPVIDEDLDDVAGVVHVKQAVAVPRPKRAEVPAAALMEDVVRVPDTVHLDVLLEKLRTSDYQLAIVVDEYGGTAGIVTLEDLVEEIVGEVADEHDRHRAGVIGTPWQMTFPADLRPDELREQAGIDVPDDDAYDTVAGFVLQSLGRIPVEGDTVTLPGGGTLRVERMERLRIARLRFNRAPASENAEQTGGEVAL